MLSEPFADSEKLAALPNAVLSALTMSPTVMLEFSVTLAVGPGCPLGLLSWRLIVPPEKPPASDDERPVAEIEGAADWNTSFMPKNCENGVPPRLDGSDASSWMTMPLPPVAPIESSPLLKLAVPFVPSAPLSALTN